MTNHTHTNGTIVIVNGKERMCSSEVGGTPKANLVTLMMEAQGGRCMVCTQPMTREKGHHNTAEYSHVLPGCCGSKTGIVPGNGFAGCRRCNTNADRMTDGDLRPFVKDFPLRDTMLMTFPAGWRVTANVTLDAHAEASDAACRSLFG